MKQNQRMKNRNIVYATILFGLVCFGPPQRAQAVVPVPDGGYAGGNTAEGHTDLLSPTVSSYKTAIGLFSPSATQDAILTRLLAPEHSLPTFQPKIQALALGYI